MYLDEKSFTSPPVESKPDVYAIRTLIAWLEKQPAERIYNWKNCKGKCLLGLYMADHGIAWMNGAGAHSYSKFINQTEGDWQRIAGCQPWTMGAATARARALLP